MLLSLDLGCSTAKIVLLNDQGERTDAVQTGLCESEEYERVIQTLLSKNHLSASNISRMILTGAGAERLEECLPEIPRSRVSEFEAIGLGGLIMSNLEEAMVMSIGTGTAFVRASTAQRSHVGGSGVGGGTLQGLSSLLIRETDISTILAAAEKGDLGKVDLSIGDVSYGASSLSPEVTASNFGKLSPDAAQGDIALGLLNLLYQTVGTMAVFACAGTDIRDIAAVGTAACLPQAKQFLNDVGRLYGFRFHIPEHAEFAAAVGAAAYVLKNRPAE